MIHDASAPSNPPALSVEPDHVPATLTDLPRWVCWTGHWETAKDGAAKLTKMPVDPKNGKAAKSNDSSTWSTFAQALAWHRQHSRRSRGIGFIFNGDGIVGVDLDSCRDPATGHIEPWAETALKQLDSYAEVSPSGTGFKVFVRGTIPSSGKRGRVEMYATGRFFTVTGQRFEATSADVCERTEALQALHARYLAKPTTTSLPSRNGHAPDRQRIVERAAKYVAKMEPAISGQGGHDQTFSVACRLVVDFDLAEAEAWPILCDFNERCDPPWAEKDLRHKLQDALKQPGERGALLRSERPPSSGAQDRRESRNGYTSPPCRESRHVVSDDDPEAEHDPVQDPLASVKTTCLANVTASKVDWLWRGRIPLGAITILDGHPDMGKSLLMAEMAYCVSTGKRMPLEGDDVPQPEAAGVLLLAEEDDLARTIRPRLDAAGADVKRIHHVDEIDGRPPVIPDHLPQMKLLIRKLKVRLVIIDPISLYLSGKVDAHKDAEVRAVTRDLKRVAEETQTAFLLIRHFNKMSSESEPINRGGGSIAWSAAARSNLMLGVHPEDVGLRVLARIKGNLSKPPPHLGYRIVSDGQDRPHLEWDTQPVDVDTADLMKHHRGRRPEALEAAKEFLQQFLSGGPRLASETKAAATEGGIKEITLERAKVALGVMPIPPLIFGGPWRWKLPESTSASDQSPATPAQMMHTGADRILDAGHHVHHQSPDDAHCNDAHRLDNGTFSF